MKLRPDVVGVSCEALHNLFSEGGASGPALVEQGLRANVIPFLLSLLDTKLQVPNPSSTKAQIVACLKSMASSPQHSDEVRHTKGFDGIYFFLDMFTIDICLHIREVYISYNFTE